MPCAGGLHRLYCDEVVTLPQYSVPTVRVAFTGQHIESIAALHPSGLPPGVTISTCDGGYRCRGYDLDPLANGAPPSKYVDVSWRPVCGASALGVTLICLEAQSRDPAAPASAPVLVSRPSCIFIDVHGRSTQTRPEVTPAPATANTPSSPAAGLPPATTVELVVQRNAASAIAEEAFLYQPQVAPQPPTNPIK